MSQQCFNHDSPSKYASLFKFPVILASLALMACGNSGGGSVGNSNNICTNFSCQEMIENLADNVITPMIVDFENKAATLDSAMAAWLETPTNEDLKLTARQSWDDAMLAWQSIEVVQTGPLIENTFLLRDSIYSWPAVSTCVVDQEVIEAETQGESYDISSRTPVRKGLAALEYLLYTSTLDHTCPSTTNKTLNWDARPDTDRLSLRAQFAKAVSEDLVSLAGELKSRWVTNADSFRVELLNPNSAVSRFSSPTAVINALSDALFYIETQVKDIKLAEPLALKGDKCVQGEADCATLVENVLSARSKEHIRQNLLAFEQVFLGNSAAGVEGLGYDDLIDAANGGENVSAAMEADISNALNALDALGSLSLKQAVTDVNGINLATGVHESTKKITDRLKSDFLNLLGLSIPGTAAGDGD